MAKGGSGYAGAMRVVALVDPDEPLPSTPRTAGFRLGRRTRIIDARGHVRTLCQKRDLPAGAPRNLVRPVTAANRHSGWPLITRTLLYPSAFAAFFLLTGAARGVSFRTFQGTVPI